MKECWEAREANQETSSGQLGKEEVDKAGGARGHWTLVDKAGRAIRY